MISVCRWCIFEQRGSHNWTNGFDFGHNVVVKRLFRWWLIQLSHLPLISALLHAVGRRRHKDPSLLPRPLSDYFLSFYLRRLPWWNLRSWGRKKEDLFVSLSSINVSTFMGMVTHWCLTSFYSVKQNILSDVDNSSPDLCLPRSGQRGRLMVFWY